MNDPKANRIHNRALIRSFALAMAHILDTEDHNWRQELEYQGDQAWQSVFSTIPDHLVALIDAVAQTPQDNKTIISRAAYVATLCMMIAALAGGLEEMPQTSGQSLLIETENFLSIAKMMRGSQQRYFKNRDREELINAKQFEKMVDESISPLLDKIRAYLDSRVLPF